MTKEMMEAILEQVKYKDWTFHVEQKTEYIDGGGYMGQSDGEYRNFFYLQVRFPDADLMTGEIEMQHGRKWILSKYMTKSEIVTTAFKAIMTAEEHEIREKFRYRGRMIFGPHFNVDALHRIAREIEVRSDPKSIAVD